MNGSALPRNGLLLLSIAVVPLVFGLAEFALAQNQPAGAPAPPPPTAKASAPFDLTGYWVSIITEDWRWRMVTPAKGDYASVPINVAAKRSADLWDPAKDEAAGEQCKSYGAPAIMRIPERVHITWQDDNTLKLETDAGQQTRLFHFGNWKEAEGAPATWQGDSVAEWEFPGRGGPGTGSAAAAGASRPGDKPAPRFGSLKVVTTHIRPGYLRKNGVPYSDKATLTEYWDMYAEHLMTGSHKDERWFVVTTIVDDPVYLQGPWVTSLNFKGEPDGSKWEPQPCSARW